jgi:hypothetical protein
VPGCFFSTNKSCFDAPDFWMNSGAVLFLVFAWVGYWLQWHRNAEEFSPKGAPWRATEEGIRQEWESDYIDWSREKARKEAARGGKQSR